MKTIKTTNLKSKHHNPKQKIQAPQPIQTQTPKTPNQLPQQTTVQQTSRNSAQVTHNLKCKQI